MNYDEMEKIRNKLGLTIRSFAGLFGISPSTYYSYKTARKPSGSVLILLLLLKKKPDEMLIKLRNIKIV